MWKVCIYPHGGQKQTETIHRGCGQKILENLRVPPVFHKKRPYYYHCDLFSYSLFYAINPHPNHPSPESEVFP